MQRRIVFGECWLDDAQLAERVARHAGALQAAGIGYGDTMALLMRNDPCYVELLLAGARVGAAVVPINWHFKDEEVRHVLEDSGARLVIGHADLIEPLGNFAPETARYAIATPPEIVRAYGLDGRHGAPPAPALDWATRTRAAEAWTGTAPAASPQTMHYTSGTTGRPKGVRRPAVDAAGQQRIAKAMAHVFGSRPGMRTLACAPLYHGAPNAMALSTLRAGGTLVIMPRFSAEEFLSLVATHRITHTFMVPTMFVRLLRLPAEVRARYDVGSLEWVVHGAAPCPPEVKRAMIEWLGDRVYEYYGATELGPVTRASAAEWRARPGTLGRAVPNTDIRIYDPAGRICRAGEPGEIYARNTDYPDFTYHNQPERRAEVGRDGLVTCGDVGWLDADGYLFLSDRKRDMVICGGVNVYPAEIEAALALMPGVADSAVFGIPDPEYGEKLCAHVQPLPGATVDAAAVQTWLRERIAGYKVPRLVEISAYLPREESGKIMKRKLRDAYWQNEFLRS